MKHAKKAIRFCFPDFHLKFGTTRTVGFQEFWKLKTDATKVGWVYLLGTSIAKIE